MSGQTAATDVWVLNTINGNLIDARITIEFPKEGRIAGQAPCNRYFAAQTAPLPWFEVGPIGATKMACPKLDLESQYFTLLQQMTTAEITGDTLLLKAETNDNLVFKTP